MSVEPVSVDPGSRGQLRAPRRTPRYRVFIGTGVLVGVVTAAVLTYVGDPGQGFGRGAVLGYLAAFCSLLGALGGGAVAVAVESFVNRSPRGRGGARGRRGRARSPRA